MKHKVLIASLLLGSALLATAAKDPVLMKINGKDIKLSEFEYLYHKNSQQQIEKETLEQYVDRFVTYKLKVADAEAAGIDTLRTFKREFSGYKKDIIKPFLEDSTVRERLVEEAYSHKLKNVNIDHFMYALGNDYGENLKNTAFVDSIRQCVLNGEKWEDLALKYSIDGSVKNNKGHYGFITAGTFPYEFEKVVYETPVGQISKPFRTDFGIHMIRVNEIRDDEGEVRCQHILKMFPRVRVVTDSMKIATKNKIDSIYAALKAGADFNELAKKGI
jgi:peptidyl-prolyl cis-trans isomerase SurA